MMVMVVVERGGGGRAVDKGSGDICQADVDLFTITRPLNSRPLIP